MQILRNNFSSANFRKVLEKNRKINKQVFQKNLPRNKFREVSNSRVRLVNADAASASKN